MVNLAMKKKGFHEDRDRLNEAIFQVSKDMSAE